MQNIGLITKMILKKHCGAYNNKPTRLIAAHEMGHSIIALQNNLRLQFTSIITENNRGLRLAQAKITYGNRSDTGNFQAGGVAGVIYCKLIDEKVSKIEISKEIYKGSIWGSILDVLEFKKEKNIFCSFNLKSKFYKAVCECLPLIRNNRQAFFNGVDALVADEIVFGVEIKSIYDGNQYNREKNLTCLNGFIQTGEVNYACSSINRTWM